MLTNPTPPSNHDEPGRNWLALGGMLCGIAPWLILPASVAFPLLSLFLLPLFLGAPLAAVGLSVKGLKWAAKHDGKGRLQAWMGLLSAACPLFIVILMIVFFSAWASGVIQK
jgi:hypothetical protein